MKYLVYSLNYAIKSIAKLIEKNEPMLVSEALLNIVRDFYQYRTQKDPYARATKLLVEVDILLTDNEAKLLDDIETNSRNQDKYIEVTKEIDLRLVSSILDKLKINCCS